VYVGEKSRPGTKRRPSRFFAAGACRQKINNEIFWVVPLSTKQKPLDFYFNYDDPSGTPVAAVLAQLRLVSINRFRRDIYVLPATLLHEVRARLRAFLS
jgi:hypothetical protein